MRIPVSVQIFLLISIRAAASKRNSLDMISWGTTGLNFGGCNCNCDGKGRVQLMAIQKIVEVPKIKVHDFGKKEEWDIDGRISNLDLATDDMVHNKYALQVNAKPEGYEDDWEMAGRYDFDKNEWDFGSGKMGFDSNFLNINS